MAILDMFNSRTKKERLSHITNLILLAGADGSVTRDELSVIFQVGHKIGLTQSEMKRIINRTDSVKLTFPDNLIQKCLQLNELVLLMMVDGEIDNNEMKICLALAKAMDFPDPTRAVNATIEQIYAILEKGATIEEALNELNPFGFGSVDNFNK